MSDKLSVTIEFVRDHYEVTAEMVELEVLPAAIFLYENFGTVTLGEFQGVAFLSDLTSRQEFTGTPIDTFANKYVRKAEMFQSASSEEEAEKIKEHLINSVKNLKAEVLTQQPNTQIVEV